MAPTKPHLRPIMTPKNMSFPSELYYNSPRTAASDTIKNEEPSRPSLSPPSSYTEFLKALTPVFSPASANGPSFPRSTSSSSLASSNNGPHPSPISISSSPASATFPVAQKASSKKKRNSTSLQPPSPVSAPLPAKTSSSAGRMLPPPPYAAYSPAVSPPRSATVVRSPYPSPEWRIRYVESPRSGIVPPTPRSVSVQHVVTTTVTFKRPPPLGPPPKGKKRRVRKEGQ
ncbi:hypothetical protein SI65_01270 [Aspergillus cristatus]|uniref:Uncharacterized protein n=1 Tax=Aspergillus cristatus TaxID=573508 RepID=A0A1E3BSB2_ASPCR|nr:hypothetical protein SI65_01270 [Aspergillus cristatus]